MRTIAVVLFITGLVAAGFFWRKADAAAAVRAQILAEPYSEDADVSISFSAGGFLNRDIKVVAYDFGERDQAIEDQLTDQILHDSLGRVLYKQGFRYIVVPGSNTLQRITARSAE